MSLADLMAHPRVARWLPVTLNGGMLLLLLASLAQWTWLLIKPPLPPPVLAPPPSPAPTGTFPLQPLLAAHLFGQAGEDMAGQDHDNLPVSSLNLVLTGVIALDTGGYALISVNGQPQEPYAVGQAVTGGAVLHAVHPERAVIRRNGSLESLVLEETDKTPSQAARVPVAPASIDRQVAEAARAPVGETAGAASPGEAEEPIYMMPSERTAAPPDMLKQATLLPAPGGGATVRLIQPGSVYEKLKMRSGDVIKSINGQPINTPQDAIRSYQQMPNTGAVQIEIMRDGRSRFLSHQFSQN